MRGLFHIRFPIKGTAKHLALSSTQQMLRQPSKTRLCKTQLRNQDEAFLKPQVRARKLLAFALDLSANLTSLCYFQHYKPLPNVKLKSESGCAICTG